MEIGPKATALGRFRTFVLAKLDLGGGDMKVATINIWVFRLHTPEPIIPDIDGCGGERAAASTMTDTGDTTTTDPVYVQFFEAPAPDPLNDEAFRVVVAHPMAKNPGRPLFPLTEANWLVVGSVYPM